MDNLVLCYNLKNFTIFNNNFSIKNSTFNIYYRLYLSDIQMSNVIYFNFMLFFYIKLHSYTIPQFLLHNLNTLL